MRGDAGARGQRPDHDGAVDPRAVLDEQVAPSRDRRKERDAQCMKLFADATADVFQHRQFILGRLAQVHDRDDVVDAWIRGREQLRIARGQRREQLERAQARARHVPPDDHRQGFGRSGGQTGDQLAAKPDSRRQSRFREPLQTRESR